MLYDHQNEYRSLEVPHAISVKHTQNTSFSFFFHVTVLDGMTVLNFPTSLTDTYYSILTLKKSKIHLLRYS
ncbi:hypothetical protein AQUCO_00600428v1 [Aquilegia coerulea]|uniref:Uncharacterized protein n=1 Tax=Aquilegia coerulea TaxID=218851 RepID=A0A2G5EPN9_AQUCA|nr:hypothetical protein AQUCO_00600428v1 [Aquilegia coerulea]